jgi:hypothetical protein
MTSLSSTTALAAILAAAYDDAANARIGVAAHQLYITDLDVLGQIPRPNDRLHTWIRQVGIGSLTTTADILTQDFDGVLGVQEADPIFGMELRARRQRLAAAMHHIITPTPYLTRLEERIFANPDVARRLQQAPHRHNRLRLAATAHAYRLPILSGNRYYAPLANDIPLPGGVYDPTRDQWLVQPT